MFWQDRGGRGTGELTVYSARCAANFNTIILAEDLGDDGTKRSAVRDWNRIAKEVHN